MQITNDKILDKKLNSIFKSLLEVSEYVANKESLTLDQLELFGKIAQTCDKFSTKLSEYSKENKKEDKIENNSISNRVFSLLNRKQIEFAILCGLAYTLFDRYTSYENIMENINSINISMIEIQKDINNMDFVLCKDEELSTDANKIMDEIRVKLDSKFDNLKFSIEDIEKHLKEIKNN